MGELLVTGFVILDIEYNNIRTSNRDCGVTKAFVTVRIMSEKLVESLNLRWSKQSSSKFHTRTQKLHFFSKSSIE